MKNRRTGALGAALVVAALTLTACSTAETPEEEIEITTTDEEPSDSEEPTETGPSTITVGWNQPLYSFNSNTDHGNASANAVILYMTQSGFNYYDGDLNLVPDTSFGTYEKVSDDPLVVDYAINSGVVWSDGTPIDAADLLLNWAGISGNLNDEIEYDEETGEPIIGENQVFFASGSPGLALVEEVPTVSEDGAGVTLNYTKPFADWETAFGMTVPAHVVAKIGLGIEDPAEGKAAVIAAIQNDDRAALAAIGEAYRTGFDFTSLPSDPALYVGSGPYVLSEYVEGQYLTVVKNELYTGDHAGKVDQITVRYNEDPQAQVQALQNGEIDMLAPQATADTLAALEAIDGITVESSVDGTYEHVDMVQDNGGPFDAATYGGDAEKARMVREAFLKTIPRQTIVDQLIKPLNPNAEIRNSFILVPEDPGYPQMVAENGSAAYADVDIEGAAALLAEAGVTTPVDVRFLFGASNVRRQNEYVLIQESAAQAGFNVINSSSDNWGSMLSEATDQYDAALFGWQSTSLAVTESDANFRTGGANNFYGYSNPEVDALFDQLQTETDPAAQLAIQIEVEKHLWADAFGTTIFQFPGVNAWNSEITGVQPIAISPTIFQGFWNWEK